MGGQYSRESSKKIMKNTSKRIKKTVYIKTFGCQMNKADSRRLKELFAMEGYNITEKKSKADVMVYNTCSVRGHAENKAMSHLGRLKFAKKNKPDLKICVVGCMAQRMGEEIIERLPHVSIVVGPSTMFRIPLMIEEEVEGVVLDTADSVKEFSDYIDEAACEKSEYSGYIPIMKGCNNFCSYCIVPYVRGREQYRDKSDVINECRSIAKKGIKEVMLLGQTVNSHPRFKDILKEAASISGIERVRFVTSYPGQMDREIVDIVAEHSALCNYFHIPLQSGSDRILKKMNRKYTAESFLDIVLYIREKIPSASVSTDIIVGFPEEKNADFQKTLDIVEKAVFDQCFTFKYSPRPMTTASKMDDDVSVKVKKERLAILNRECEKRALERNKMLNGKRVELFSEGGRKGRTDTYKIVFWEGSPSPPGEKVIVNVKKAMPHSLKGVRVL